MQSYERAYRDPKSPLTPLTPLSCNAAFEFNFGGDNSLKDPIANVRLTPLTTRCHDNLKPTKQKKCSEKFLKIRSIFSPGTKVNVKPIFTKEMKETNKLTRNFEKLTLGTPEMSKPASDYKSISKEFREIESIKMENSSLTDESNDLKKRSLVQKSKYRDIVMSASSQEKNNERVNSSVAVRQTTLPVERSNSSEKTADIVEKDQLRTEELYSEKTACSSQMFNSSTCATGENISNDLKMANNVPVINKNLTDQSRIGFLNTNLQQTNTTSTLRLEEIGNNKVNQMGPKCKSEELIADVTTSLSPQEQLSQEEILAPLQEKPFSKVILFRPIKRNLKSKLKVDNKANMTPSATMQTKEEVQLSTHEQEKQRLLQTLKQIYRMCLDFFGEKSNTLNNSNFQMSPMVSVSDTEIASDTSAYRAFLDNTSLEALKQICRICFYFFEEKSNVANSNNSKIFPVTTVTDIKVANDLPSIFEPSEHRAADEKKYRETLKQIYRICYDCFEETSAKAPNINNTQISPLTTVSGIKVANDLSWETTNSHDKKYHETFKQIYRICYDSFEEESNAPNNSNNSRIFSITTGSDIKIANDLSTTIDSLESKCSHNIESPLTSEQICHERDITAATARNIQNNEPSVSLKSSVSSAILASLATIQTGEKIDNGKKTPQISKDQLSDDELLTPLQETPLPKMVFSRPVKRILKRHAFSDSSIQISPFTTSAEQKIISDANIANKLPATFHSFTSDYEFDQTSVVLNPELNLRSNRQENNTSSPYRWNWLEKNAFNANNSVRRKIGFKKCSPVQGKPLSPRVEAVLRQTGLSKWNKLFENEEIDMEVLQVLTEMELEKLGILSLSERTQLLTECTKF